MTKRIVASALALVAWVAGSVLGATPSAVPAAAAPLLQIGQAHAGYVPVLDGSQPIFILFLGSDARPGQAVEAQRSDSIHLVALNPAKHKATILGFPRDAWVSIPGRGSNKINAAMVSGGPELTVQTVEALTGITIDYWALTSFEGFKRMIDEIGGLTIDLPFRVPGSVVSFEEGEQRLDGGRALTLARNRHSLPMGDFGRSENQGRLIVASLVQFRKEFGKDPSRLLAWIAAGLQNLQTDIPIGELMSLAFTATAINPKGVANVVVPGSTATVGGTSIVNLSAEAEAIYRDMADDGLLAKKNRPPSPNASLLD